MPTFAYDAVNNAGKKQSGTIEATSADEALKKIRSQGLFPSGVKEQKIAGGTGVKGTKVRDGGKKKKGKGKKGRGDLEAEGAEAAVTAAGRFRTVRGPRAGRGFGGC